MVTKFNQGIPGVPLSALDAIQDANTRDVLRALVDGWNVRNGDVGKGDSRFITKGEMGDLVVSTIGQRLGYGLDSSSNKNPSEMDWIRQLLRDLQADVMSSRLWEELGERIQQINLDVVREQQDRISAVQQVADDLAEEAVTRLGFDQVQGSAINTLQDTTENQATLISGLTTRVSGAENTIVSLQTTTQEQATSLTQLTSELNGAQSSITSLQTTTAQQAQSLNSLITRVDGAESNISTLNTTTANQANSLDSLFTRVTNAEAAITSEQTTRANADNAITNSLTTQFSQVNTSIGALQTQQNTTANSVASLSTQVTTLQASTASNLSLIQQEATTRVNADNDIYAKYSVKIDTNGYVSGYGLMSTANNSTPTSNFIVRADRFAIGSPSGPGITPAVPFIVQTTATTLNGVAVPVGVYIEDAFIRNGAITSAKIGNAEITNAKIANAAITSAKIGDAEITTAKIGSAQIDTLRVAGNAITVTSSIATRNYSSSTSLNAPYGGVLSIIVWVEGGYDNNLVRVRLNGSELISFQGNDYFNGATQSTYKSSQTMVIVVTSGTGTQTVQLINEGSPSNNGPTVRAVVLLTQR